jgi:hypothetical protein
MSKILEVLLAGRRQQGTCHDQPDESRSLVLFRISIELDDNHVCLPTRNPQKDISKRELRWDSQNLK